MSRRSPIYYSPPVIYATVCSPVIAVWGPAKASLAYITAPVVGRKPQQCHNTTLWYACHAYILYVKVSSYCFFPPESIFIYTPLCSTPELLEPVLWPQGLYYYSCGDEPSQFMWENKQTKKLWYKKSQNLDTQQAKIQTRKSEFRRENNHHVYFIPQWMPPECQPEPRRVFVHNQKKLCKRYFTYSSIYVRT